ncbi:hypothetical protein EV702DRAFT_469221 [Suillus placidus]|uniref:Uncharacterized protein n=1 Tax=Suillus placidus TaxID=48579 RepID=A0A9P7D0M9_9AGAM|nr:hypothetical protein EV702DRAFT_469221 [Suillus placidus]
MSVVMLPRCRLLLSKSIKSESWLEASQVHFRRLRSNDSCQGPRNSNYSQQTFPGNQCGGFKYGGRSNPQHVMKQKKGHILDGFSVRDASDTLLIMEKQVHKWADLPHVHRHLESFGVPRTDVQPILSIFARGQLRAPSQSNRAEKYHVERFILTAKELNQGLRLDQILTQLFYSWASDPEQQEVLLKSVSQNTLAKSNASSSKPCTNSTVPSNTLYQFPKLSKLLGVRDTTACMVNLDASSRLSMHMISQCFTLRFRANQILSCLQASLLPWLGPRVFFKYFLSMLRTKHYWRWLHMSPTFGLLAVPSFPPRLRNNLSSSKPTPKT